MIQLTPEEEKVIARTQRQVAPKGRLRVIPAAFGAVGIGLSLWTTYAVISKVENLKEVTEGFLYGFGLCIVATTFGIMGAICLAKVLMGFADDFQVHELLLKLHGTLAENRDDLHESTDD